MNRKSLLVASHVRQLGLSIDTAATPEILQHVGAILTDAVLQPGLNYRTVVRPRVLRVLDRFPEAATTSGLVTLIKCIGAEELLKWKHPEKPARLEELATFLQNQRLESVRELREWINVDLNCIRLMDLRGIGKKTIDYIKILLGLQTVAIDRHIKMFIRSAGVNGGNYDELRNIFMGAAVELAVDPSNLDSVIWNYLSPPRSFRVTNPDGLANRGVS